MWDEGLERLDALRERSLQGGGPERRHRHAAGGRLSARERLRALFDGGEYAEIGAHALGRIGDYGLGERLVPGDGVVTAFGRVHGRTVYCSSEDFTVIGGTLGEVHSRKICDMLDMALAARAPVVMINDSGGARIEEGVSSLAGYAGIFLRNTRASGMIPQIAAVMGPCAGGACYSPAICDFVFMVRGSSRMFITGPEVVRAATGEVIDAESLGGTDVHCGVSGAAHFACPSDSECIEGIRALLSYLPSHSGERPPEAHPKPVDNSSHIRDIMPDNSKKPYDVRDIIETFADEDSFCEIHASFARNCVVGLFRLDGEVAGVVANQPARLSGAIDCDAADKMARFIRFCDCFGIPLLTLVDVPAFLPGRAQEHAGIIRHGAKLLYAYSEARVPKVTLIMRKAYGGAYIAMNSREMGADVVYAWPIAEVAVMGAEGAVDIIAREKISKAPDPADLRAKLVAEYESRYMDPFTAAARGHIDEIIRPEDTRARLASAFAALRGKRGEPGRHGNMPL